MLNCFFNSLIAYFLCFVINDTSSAQWQKGLTGYCFKYVDWPFCLQTDVLFFFKLYSDCFISFCHT